MEKIAGGDGDKAPKVDELPPPGELALDSALNDLIGMDNVKAQLKSVRNWVTVQRRREQVGVLNCKPLHFLFAGNRGTGMTCIGRLLAHMLRDLRVLETGQFIEVNPKDILNAAHTGDAEKKVSEWIERAKGGLLMIDDAHLLRQTDSRSRENAGIEAVMALTKAMEKNLDKTKQVWPQPFVVIVAGQRAEMNALWAANKSFKILKLKFKFPIARTFELFRARSRLYRSQILQVNIRWKALAEIYTMHSFAPFSNLNFFVKNC